MEDFGTTTYELASFGTRFFAYLIDTLILFVISFMLNIFLVPFFDPTLLQLTLINTVIFSAYHWYFLARHEGQSPGKKAMNIRVVKADGTPINDMDAVLRVLGYLVGQFTLYLGYLWALFDSHSQAWQDKMANTYVVRTGEGPRTISL